MDTSGGLPWPGSPGTCLAPPPVGGARSRAPREGSRKLPRRIRSGTRRGAVPAVGRRRFLAVSSAALGAALLPFGRVWASDAPEVADVRFGMIALTDCSPIVIAHEKGLFKKYGLNSVVSKGASWAAIRDSLSNGDIDATHMLLGMPIASTMGLLGSPKKAMVIPWLLNRNGQSISLKAQLKGRVQADPKAL